jgi:hypothetical protein
VKKLSEIMKVDQLLKYSRELLGLDLNRDVQQAFSIYADELLAWNKHTNLTAITDPEAIEMRHFLDSLSVLLAVPIGPGQRVIDVGAGAGFPPRHAAEPGQRAYYQYARRRRRAERPFPRRI